MFWGFGWPWARVPCKTLVGIPPEVPFAGFMRNLQGFRWALLLGFPFFPYRLRGLEFKIF